ADAAARFFPVPARRVDVGVEEGDTAAELGVVGVARQYRAIRMLRLGRGDHVHLRARVQVAEDPFDVARGAEPARGVAGIAHAQHAELYRRFARHVHPQVARDAILLVLVDAVAEAVADPVGAPTGSGQTAQRHGPP